MPILRACIDRVVLEAGNFWDNLVPYKEYGLCALERWRYGR